MNHQETTHSSGSYRPGMYLGIDLGTTNTVVARVMVGLDGELGVPEVLSIDQQVDDLGNMEARDKLSSMLWIDEEGRAIPGDHAYRQYLTRGHEHVLAWWKNHIGLNNTSGEPYRWLFHNKYDWDAVQAASAVLKHIREQLQSIYPQTDFKPVVTVPASFPEQMKRAVSKAIELAGWCSTDQSPILLYEPIAALIAYLQRYEREYLQLPPAQRTPDWQEGGYIVVFDIGGGTVDVTLVAIETIDSHEPNKSSKRLRAIVEDYAPHTLLGGFRFDELLAEFLYQKFCKTYSIEPSKLSSVDRDFLYTELLSWAEQAKINLSSGQEQTSRRIRMPDGLRTKERGMLWDAILTRAEYEDAIRPLLGENLDCSSNLPPLERQAIGDASTIVEPVIRLLQKRNIDPSDIRAVLLVGGMGYVEAIRQRIARLFGENTLVLWRQVDPLKSIAFGAAIHNAQLSNGLSPHTVALRSAALMVMREASKQPIWMPLIQEGVMLPYGEQFTHTSEPLLFPAGSREVSLQAKYNGLRRRGIVFRYPEHLTNNRERTFLCQVSVHSHTHTLHLHAYLQENPDITVDALFDENPENTEIDTTTVGLKTAFTVPSLSPPSNPEENKTHIKIPELVHILRTATSSDVAASHRKNLEKAYCLGFHIPIIEQSISGSTPDGKQHLLLLIAYTYSRYTHDNGMNILTPPDVAAKLQGHLGAVIQRTQSIVHQTTAPSQTRNASAYALGFAGMWNPSLVDVTRLIDVAFSSGTHSSIQIEVLRALGRICDDEVVWGTLLLRWRSLQHVGAAEAALWAICRILTRTPTILLRTPERSIAQSLYAIQHQALIHSNPSLQITGWRTVALLSMTRELGLSEPRYAKFSSILLHSLKKLAETLPPKPPATVSAATYQNILQAAGRFLQAIEGGTIVGQLIRELENLPILRS